MRPRGPARVGRTRRPRTSAWDELPVDPGRLFVVGDPKQSIYRFRRADIAAFLRARSAFGAAPRRLTRNFRTARPVIDFVNDVFRELIVAEPESQPEYVALGAGPRRGPGRARRSCSSAPSPSWRSRRRRAARARGRATSPRSWAARSREEWQVSRRSRRRRPKQLAPCRLGDICILLPARTSFGHLEDALDAAGIPYRAETSSLVYGTREIRDLLMVLQAVDDPTDELALVSALRSPVFGCGDDDLFTYKVQHGGTVGPPASAPRDAAARPPGRRRACARSRRGTTPGSGLSPSELLDRIVRERRVLEVGFAHGRPRDLWRRVRFVVEQARAFADAEGGSLPRLPRLGRRCRAARVRVSSRRCCPRPTTTRCGSSPSTAPRDSSSRSRSCRA